MRLWLGAGVALGGVVNLLDGLGLFSLLLPAWLLLAGPTMPGQPGMPLKGRGLRVGLLVVGMAMAILPFTLRNLVVGGELVPIAAKSGVERYAGNNPNAWGGHMTIPGIRPNPAGLWSDGRRVAEWALGRQARSSEVSAYWTDRTLEFIRAEPGHFLSLVWTRLLLSINAYEIAQTYSWQYEAMRSKLLATLPGIGLLLSLGLAGALLALPRIRDLVPWYLLAVAVLTGLMLTQVNWRDRMPLLLGLLPFAALYLVVIRDWLRKRRWSRFIPGLLLVSAMAVLVHLPRVDANIRQREIAVAERNSRTSATLRQLMERLDAPQLSPSLRRHLYLRIANLRRSHLDHEGAARVLKEAVIHFPDDQQSRRLLERAAKRIDDQVSVVEARRAIERRRSTAANEIHGR